jgi:hypothetical protein
MGHWNANTASGNEEPTHDVSTLDDVAIRRGSGRRAISAAGDGAVCVWDLDSG